MKVLHPHAVYVMKVAEIHDVNISEFPLCLCPYCSLIMSATRTLNCRRGCLIGQDGQNFQKIAWIKSGLGMPEVLSSSVKAFDERKRPNYRFLDALVSHM